ncbi:MAG: recombination mediator RecR [Clostridia bacterium]|jgi:recombination protein RecR|nr:recombination mediator RecR [Clostridia bacterium]
MENEPLEKLVAAFRSLPGVGLKSAQRFAYYIIKQSISEAQYFADSILNAKQKIKYCKECGDYTDREICPICLHRDAKIICVVAEPKDVTVIEKVKNFNGVYHVLNGTISPLENRGPNDIRIKELLARIKEHQTIEVIVALNPDVEGDATAMYIAKLLKPLGVKVTRIAQGISMGTDIEYADEITLTKAIEGRIEL